MYKRLKRECRIDINYFWVRLMPTPSQKIVSPALFEASRRRNTFVARSQQGFMTSIRD